MMRTRVFTFLMLALCRCSGPVVQAPRHAPTVAVHAPTPTSVATPRYVSLAAGSNFVCGLKSDATVWCWGSNLHGQLAQPRDLRYSVTPVEVVGARGATQLVVREMRACVRTADGRMVCWGAPYRNAPQGAQHNMHVPHEVPGIHDAVLVATGGSAVCAVTREHRLQCMGLPQFGNSEMSLPETDVVRVALGFPVVCIERVNGSVQCRDSLALHSTWSPVAPGPPLLDLAVLTRGCIARRADSTTFLWKISESEASAPSTFMEWGRGDSIATSEEYACVVHEGRVRCGTHYDRGGLDGAGISWSVPRLDPSEVPGLAGVQQAVIGDAFTCVLQDGVPRCWGQESHVLLSEEAVRRVVPEGLPAARGVTWLTVGNGSCLIDATGLPWCWGSNHALRAIGPVGAEFLWVPQPREDLRDSVEVASGTDVLCARTRDARVRCIVSYVDAAVPRDRNNESPEAPRRQRVVDVSIERSVQSIAVSLGGELCVVTDDGATHCGMPPGSSAASWTLRPVTGLPAASRVVAFENTLCAWTVSSGVWCWGDNRSWGAIENSEATVVRRPVARSGLARATTLAIGTAHACATDHDGTLLCWGRAREGQLAIAPRSPLGAPVRVPGITDVIDVAVGAHHTCVLKREGTVFCFGVNTHGQLGDGTRHDHATPTPVRGLTGVRAVRAWGDTTCALGHEGHVWCWGDAQEAHLGSGLVDDALTPAAVPLVPR